MSVSLLPGQDPHEIFDLVDAYDQVIGRATRAEVHATRALHRAVHVLLYNAAGHLYLQRRSEAKDMFPGCWDSSCSGHVASGEDYPDAARRELREELGAAATLRPLLKMPARPETSQEFIQVFVAGPVEGPFRPNPAEIAEAQFVTVPDLDRYVAEQPHGFAGGFRTLWTQHRAEILRAISPSLLPPAPAQAVPVEVVVTPPPPPGGSNPTPAARSRGLFGLIAAGAVLLFKFKFLAFAALKTGLSMFATIWVYSLIFGWGFAVGIVLLIFVHEMGHVIAAKWLGMPVSAPLFIPFVGAYIMLKEHPRDAGSEALMAYGGPLAGAIGGWVCFALGVVYNLPLLLGIASFTFFLNLFNLIPVPPLDGGRICAAVSPWFWILGLVVLGSYVLYFHPLGALPIILIVLVSSIPRFKEAFFSAPSEKLRAYYSGGPARRILVALAYLSLIAVLFLGLTMAGLWLAQTVPASTGDN